MKFEPGSFYAYFLNGKKKDPNSTTEWPRFGLYQNKVNNQEWYINQLRPKCRGLWYEQNKSFFTALQKRTSHRIYISTFYLGWNHNDIIPIYTIEFPFPSHYVWFSQFWSHFRGTMHCLPQRLKSMLFEFFSNGAATKGVRKKFQRTLFVF